MRTLSAVVVVVLMGCSEKPVAAPAVPPPAPAKPKLTKAQEELAKLTPEQHAERTALIAKSQKEGLLGDINWKRREIFVGAEFYATDFKVKQAIAYALELEAMHQRQSEEVDLKFLDVQSGKRVGTFSTLTWQYKTEE